MSVSLIPRGRNFIRGAILRAEGITKHQDVMEASAARWGSHQADAITRAAIAPLTAGEVGEDPAANEFLGLVRERSVYGRLTGLRKVPFGVRMVGITAGASGHWVGESSPKPVSKPVLDGSTLVPAKVSSIVVVTSEALRAKGRVAEAALQDDLVRAITATWDEAFLDVTNAGEADVRPASITYAATKVTGTADPADDIAKLIAAFEGDFSTAYFVMSPQLATQLAMQRTGTSFAFPDIGPRGGSILGIPVLTSRQSAPGQIVLMDPTGIIAADDGVSLSKAQHASLLMSDDPEGDAEPELVSLWQSNLTAFRAEVFVNWEVQRAGSVAVITGANYPAAA